MLYEGTADAGVLTFQSGTYASDTLLTFLLGLGIVFIGLIILIVIIKVMGAVMSRKSRNAAPAPVQEHVEAESASSPEPDHGELIAAVSAAIASARRQSRS